MDGSQPKSLVLAVKQLQKFIILRKQQWWRN
jgi:hypothetical protein